MYVSNISSERYESTLQKNHFPIKISSWLSGGFVNQYGRLLDVVYFLSV